MFYNYCTIMRKKKEIKVLIIIIMAEMAVSYVAGYLIEGRCRLEQGSQWVGCRGVGVGAGVGVG